MSLIRIGCKSSSSLWGVLVPTSSGSTWLVGSVPAILSWGDRLRIDLKHDRGRVVTVLAIPFASLMVIPTQ